VLRTAHRGEIFGPKTIDIRFGLRGEELGAKEFITIKWYFIRSDKIREGHIDVHIEVY
jgi:hypothetical protein